MEMREAPKVRACGAEGNVLKHFKEGFDMSIFKRRSKAQPKFKLCRVNVPEYCGSKKWRFKSCLRNV